MIYNFDYSLLYERMAEYRYSQSSLANAIPISRTSINHKLQGKNLFTQWEIKRICELLEIPPTKVGRYFWTKCTETCTNVVTGGNYGTNHINQRRVERNYSKRS